MDAWICDGVRIRGSLLEERGFTVGSSNVTGTTERRGQPLQALPNRPLAGQSPTSYPARPAHDPAARRAEDRSPLTASLPDGG